MQKENNKKFLIHLSVQDFKLLMEEWIHKHLHQRRSSNGKKIENLIPRKELAVLLKVTTKTIDVWVRENILPEPVTIGRLIYFREKDIEDFIKRGGSKC